MRCRRQAPTGRHANPTLVGGSDDEAAWHQPVRARAPPMGRLGYSGYCNAKESLLRVVWPRSSHALDPGKKSHEDGQPIHQGEDRCRS